MAKAGLDQLLRHRSKSRCHTDTTRRLITRTVPAHLPLDKTPNQLDGVQVRRIRGQIQHPTTRTRGQALDIAALVNAGVVQRKRACTRTSTEPGTRACLAAGAAANPPGRSAPRRPGSWLPPCSYAPPRPPGRWRPAPTGSCPGAPAPTPPAARLSCPSHRAEPLPAKSPLHPGRPGHPQRWGLLPGRRRAAWRGLARRRDGSFFVGQLQAVQGAVHGRQADGVAAGLFPGLDQACSGGVALLLH